MRLACRMFKQDDVPALVRLWSEHGGWDGLDVKTWSERFLTAPLGGARICVAEDTETGELLGQFVFFPFPVSVEGARIPALRAFAPVINTKVRTSVFSLMKRTLQHPIIEMYRHAILELRKSGFRLVYILPDPRWAKLLRLLPQLQCGSFPLWSLPLPLKQYIELPAGYCVEQTVRIDGQIDRLMHAATGQHGCTVIRDTQTLPWKLSHGQFHMLGVRYRDELVGFVASQEKGDRQWLICDLIATDLEDALRATVAAACNLGHARHSLSDREGSLAKAAILATSAMQPVLSDLGFKQDSYSFPLVIHSLDDAISKQSVAPPHWYVSAND